MAENPSRKRIEKRPCSSVIRYISAMGDQAVLQRPCRGRRRSYHPTCTSVRESTFLRPTIRDCSGSSAPFPICNADATRAAVGSVEHLASSRRGNQRLRKRDRISLSPARSPSRSPPLSQINARSRAAWANLISPDPGQETNIAANGEGVRGHMPRANYRDCSGAAGRLAHAAPVIILGLVASAVPARAADLDYAAQRAAMVRTIGSYVAEVSSVAGHDRIAPRVLEVMGVVPRHEFVPDDVRREAYADRPLPIGYGQTISQPLIVAIMTDLLRVAPNHVVLEIGTGSGYQAAVLAQLARQVYTIEIVPGLANTAAQRLRSLGYANVATRLGDGYYGWPEAAPFDGIIVTAAASYIPPPLIQQLKAGGRMVIPVGAPFALQHLMLVEVDGERRVRTRQLLPVQFVPLAGRH